MYFHEIFNQILVIFVIFTNNKCTLKINQTLIFTPSILCRQDIAAFREFQDFGGLFREFMEICNILVPKVSKPRQDIAAFREFCDFGRLFREISQNVAIS